MLNTNISRLSIGMFFLQLLLMQWFTVEKWWLAIVTFFALSFFLVPKIILKFKPQFLEAVENDKWLGGIWAVLKMWFLAHGYYLALAVIYYLGMAIIIVIGSMSFNAGIFSSVGALWLGKVVGLVLANGVFLPVVVLLALYIFSNCKRMAIKKVDSVVREEP